MSDIVPQPQPVGDPRFGSATLRNRNTTRTDSIAAHRLAGIEAPGGAAVRATRFIHKRGTRRPCAGRVEATDLGSDPPEIGGSVTTVVCVGLAVADFVFGMESAPNRPGKHFAGSFTRVGGGPAANAAVTVAALGGAARFIGHVGADAEGERIVSELAARGVDVSRVRVSAGRQSPVSAVIVDAAGERTIVNYTDPDLYAGSEPVTVENIAGAAAVLADVRWPAGAASALAAAAERRLPGILDFDQSPDDVAPLVKTASHVAFGAEALARLAGTEDPAAGLSAMRARTSAWLAVTSGSRGVHWLEDDVVRHLPAFRVDAVDTLGAGDVFHGALGWAIAAGQTEAEAVRFAAAAAAIKCTRFGGRAGIPGRDEVERFLEERTR
jgi:sulfofructose kinase